MSNTIRIFVGTDQRMAPAEQALLWSIRKHTSLPYEIHWMRAGDPKWRVGHDPDVEPISKALGGAKLVYHRDYDWDIGRESERPYSGKGWATDFTCFRFAIPELCNFQGRAIYIDADMLFLEDPAILWNTRPKKPKPWESVGFRTDVSLINCAQFKDADWWPSIPNMKAGAHTIRGYIDLLRTHRFKGNSLDAQWDCMDGLGYHPQHTKLIHYTNMRTQPWFPYPDVFPYNVPHRCPEVCDIFHRYLAEAKEQPHTTPEGAVTYGNPLPANRP